MSVDAARCMVMRGGTSKGLYFVASDLPSGTDDRDAFLMSVMGTPDPRQIDGMGGAHPLTSKVAVVSECDHGSGDVDYLFLQLGVGEALVTDRQNCGNLLAGVGPFAVERGLVEGEGSEASIRIHMLNTNGIAVAGFPLSNGSPRYSGDTSIAGVPGTAARITLDFEDIAGGTCGSLLPTGSVIDEIAGVPVTLVDNGMPAVVMRADDVGITGYETCQVLEGDSDLRSLLEKIRLEAGPLMGLGDVSRITVPKMTMVAPPVGKGDLCTRTFIPHRCHQAIGVLGAVSVATAALLPGSPPSEALRLRNGSNVVVLEHPTGTFETIVEVAPDNGGFEVRRAGVIRTARKLMDGLVFSRS
ncbi:MAG: 4-oxalomesaconate tautomerase [Acidimicrobiia bacterium]